MTVVSLISILLSRSSCTLRAQSWPFALTQFGPLFGATKHTRGLEGQPPVQYEHEVVTGDGDVESTLLQATR